MLTPWLQELRDLLAIASYDARAQALQTWERRWLVDLRTRQHLSPSAVAQGGEGLLQAIRANVQRALAEDLAAFMVNITVETRHETDLLSPDEPPWQQMTVLTVHGQALGLRRTPEDDADAP